MSGLETTELKRVGGWGQGGGRYSNEQRKAERHGKNGEETVCLQQQARKKGAVSRHSEVQFRQEATQKGIRTLENLCLVSVTIPQ